MSNIFLYNLAAEIKNKKSRNGGGRGYDLP
jgi:hypothetical protein